MLVYENWLWKWLLYWVPAKILPMAPNWSGLALNWNIKWWNNVNRYSKHWVRHAWNYIQIKTNVYGYFLTCVAHKGFAYLVYERVKTVGFFKLILWASKLILIWRVSLAVKTIQKIRDSRPFTPTSNAGPAYCIHTDTDILWRFRWLQPACKWNMGVRVDVMGIKFDHQP